jgi:O-antigen/teichoic acid export membrane protein
MYATQLVVAFVMSPIMVRGLGDQRYGIWSLVESTIAYLALFDFGVGASVVRHISRFHEVRDEEGLKRVYSTCLLIFVTAGAAVLAITLAAALLWTHPFGYTDGLASDTRWLLALFGVRLAVGLPLSVYPAMLDGFARYPTKSAIRSTFLLIGSGAFLIVLVSGGSIRDLAISNVATHIAEHVCLALAVRRQHPSLRFAPRYVDRAMLKQIRGYSVPAFVALLAGQISFRTDAIVIGSFLDPRYITFFGIAAKLVEYAKMSLYSAATVLTPEISALEARGDIAGIRRVLIQATRYVLLAMIPVQVGFVLLGRQFITLWMGDAVYADASYPSLVILSIPFSLAVSQSISGRILYGTGRLTWFARMTMVEAGLNLVMSLALVQRFGIIGVAWGTSIPNLVFNIALAIYVCRMFGVPLVQYVRQSFLKPLLLAIIPMAYWYVATSWLAIDDWATLLAVGGSGLGLYTVLALLAEFGPRACLQTIRNWQQRIVTPQNLTATAASQLRNQPQQQPQSASRPDEADAELPVAEPSAV